MSAIKFLVDPHCACTYLLFDPKQELLWLGNAVGFVRSLVFDSTTGVLSTFVRHRAHNGFPITQLLIADNTDQQAHHSSRHQYSQNQAENHVIISIAADSVSRLSAISGRLLNHVTNENHWTQLTSVAQVENEIIVAGHSPSVYALKVDNHLTINRHIDAESGILAIKTSQHVIVCGTSDGKLLFKDRDTFRTWHTVYAYSGSVADMDIFGDYLIVAGYNQTFSADPVVKIYDISGREVRLLLSKVFEHGPRFVRFLPGHSAPYFLIASSAGYVNICSLEKIYVSEESNVVEEYQVESVENILTCMAVSSSGGLIAFGDAGGVVYLIVHSPSATVNTKSRPISIASPFVLPSPSIDDKTVIGMPIYDESLLSSRWPVKMTFFVGLPPSVIPDEIIDQVKMVDFVGYAPNLFYGKRLRNQVVHDVIATKSSGHHFLGKQVPRFRSEQERAPKRSDSQTDSEDAILTAASFPSYYSKIEIQYSRFGIEDFDFGFYNKTGFGGLETNIPNSYCNSLIQCMFFTRILRSIVMWHLIDECEREFCLCCELGFLFKMLEDAKGLNCQASNFLRALNHTSEVGAMGLLEPEQPTPDTPYYRLIQNLNRFLFERLHQDVLFDQNPLLFTDSDPKSSVIQQLYGIQLITVTICQCREESSRKTYPLSIDLISSGQASTFVKLKDVKSFSDLLAQSLARETTTKAWCNKCKDYMPTEQRRVIQNLPAILNVNCGNFSEDDLQIWRAADPFFKFDVGPSIHAGSGSFKSFLPLYIRLIIDQKSQTLNVEEFNNLPSGDDTNNIYRLTSVICQIRKDNDVAHLVSFVSMADGNWYLYNDFLVRQVSDHEAVQFKSKWKSPAVLQFERIDIDHETIISRFQPPSTMDHRTFDEIMRVGQYVGYRSSKAVVMPLSYDEVENRRGYMVALDAEFVALSREETEIRTDGTRSLIRPVRLHLARVSLIRGQDFHEGVCFVDDYISTSEPIVDYLTEFSGIKPGDLNSQSALHPVIPLKSAYKKLRALLDLGCIFIGHGLKSDFRTINILVPPEQVIDTLDIYRLEGQRKISLRFLAWYVLSVDIQQETHDSIEDARTALQLYRKYLKLKERDQFDKFLVGLYDEGRRLNWKTPNWKIVHDAPSPLLTPAETLPPPKVHPVWRGKGGKASPPKKR